MFHFAVLFMCWSNYVHVCPCENVLLWCWSSFCPPMTLNWHPRTPKRPSACHAGGIHLGLLWEPQKNLLYLVENSQGGKAAENLTERFGYFGAWISAAAQGFCLFFWLFLSNPNGFIMSLLCARTPVSEWYTSTRVWPRISHDIFFLGLVEHLR